MSNQKKSYAKPELNVHGNIEVLTQATDTGTVLDAGFPSNTPLDQVTLS